jgi:MFS family permease
VTHGGKTFVSETPPSPSQVTEHSTVDVKGWWATAVLFLGALTVSIDGAAVVVALPSIKVELGFSDASLVWIVNAYIATYGGFFLLSGKLGDIFGHRPLLLYGTGIFTLASLGCALASTPSLFIVSRLLQGLGGAAIVTTVFSLILATFRDTQRRAKAVGIFSFVESGGGIAGFLLGGFLTGMLSWHWIFLVNVPIGAAVWLISCVALPKLAGYKPEKIVDFAGAATITAALIVAILAVEGVSIYGWISVRTLASFTGATVLLLIFLRLESKAIEPLIPSRVLRMRNLLLCSALAVLASPLAYAGVFISLYLQLVLRRTPLQTAFGFILPNIAVAAFSLGVSAKLIVRFGVKRSLVLGLLIGFLGLMLLTQSPIFGTITGDVIPGLLLVAVGGSATYNPILVAGASEVAAADAGLASGIIGTSTLMGGALSIAVLASLATVRTNWLLASGASPDMALNGGYHLVFLMCAACNVAAVPIVLALRGQRIS